VSNTPQSNNPYQAVPQVAYPPTSGQSSDSDSTGGLIPYKNPHALIAYYLGLFSLLPFFGLFLAIPAFILGIMGLQRRKRNPAIRGSVHAWIGIVMGGMMTLLWGGLILMGIIAALMSSAGR
jgi:hypothetical protein